MPAKEPEWIPPVEPGSREAYRLVGLKLKASREQLGLSIEEMAAQTGLDTTTLLNMERGAFIIDPSGTKPKEKK